MNFLKEPKFIITFFFVLPAWYTIWQFPESNPHMILATNILSALVGFWYGSSLGSSDKNKIIGGKLNETTPKAPGPVADPAVYSVKLRQPGDEEPAVG